MKYLLRNPALVISSFVFGAQKKTGWKSAVPSRFHLVEKRDHIFTLQFLVTGPFRRKGWDRMGHPKQLPTESSHYEWLIMVNCG